MEKVRRLTDIVGNETVRSLWDGLVAACGEREFLLFRDRTGSTSTYTYRAFNEEIDRAANVFLSMGSRPASAWPCSCARAPSS